MDHCGDTGCPTGQACFLYSGGTICQPFVMPPSYPATGANTTIVDPPGWYLVGAYPSVRYTGSLANQTQGATCTTIPVPQNSLYVKLITFIIQWDLGGFYTLLDDNYSSTLVQYRGNCAEGFYCQPTQAVNTTIIIPNGQAIDVQGQLPGTCQALKSVNAACLSTDMCLGWHIQSDGSYNNDQARCMPTSSSLTNGTPSGTCDNLNVGSGSINSNQEPFQSSARTYLLSTLVLFSLVFLYMWYRRRQSRRQQQQQRGELPFNSSQGLFSENSGAYVRQGGVYRPPDGNDNGELPAYGAHRRDERLVGPGSEEIGMYSFPVQGTPLSPLPPLPTSPYSNNNNGSVIPPGAMYAPPSSEPPPLHGQQTRTAVRTEADLREGGLLPPAYEPSSTPSLTSPVANARAGGESDMANNNVARAAGFGEKQEEEGSSSFGNSPRLSYTKEKTSFQEQDLDDEPPALHRDGERTRAERERDPDQASVSSRSSGSGSGSGSRSAVPSMKGSKTRD
ncbi:hypothetical protein BGZ58_010295 [Dissophora ornata]|nr:hypothetical protein BGZ58_010295 [Dissophora ornata]